MQLILVGHDYKYAVEQVMLTLFPEERPVYDDGAVDSAGGGISSGNATNRAGRTLCAPAARVRISHGVRYSTATTVLWYEGVRYQGTAKCVTPDSADRLLWDRLMQKIVKLSFYRAATAATRIAPPWGALTGIRPGKIATALFETGATSPQVLRTLTEEYQVTSRRAALCIDTANAGLKSKATLTPKDICLYVGIPFCPTRCAYCSFVSHDVERSMHLVEPYLAALSREMEATGQVVRELGLRVVALYIGGGTPTTLTTAQLRALTEALASHFDFSHLREYTVEAGRPDTLTQDKLSALKDASVTRICINPQTMEDHVLSAIGRRHTAADIGTAVEMVRAAGFPVLNMDLIAGLPADTPEGFARTLSRVLDFGAQNITVHTLARKKGAKIKVDEAPAPGPEAVGEMLDFALSALPQAGYAPYYLYRQKFTAGGYENVGWCLPGTENLYNIAIMEELTSILSLGGGGSTKLVDPHTGRIPRTYNPKFPYEYVEGIDRILASKEKIRDFYVQEVFQHGIDL